MSLTNSTGGWGNDPKLREKRAREAEKNLIDKVAEHTDTVCSIEKTDFHMVSIILMDYDGKTLGDCLMPAEIARKMGEDLIRLASECEAALGD